MKKIDAPLFTLLNKLPKLPLGKLLASLGHSYPTQRYGEALVVAQERLATEDVPEVIKQLYREKFSELMLRVSLIEASSQGDDAQVTALSKKLYGEPAFRAKDLEQEFADLLSRAREQKVHHHTRRITARDFVKLAKERLVQQNITDWRVRLSRRPRIHIGHGKLTQSPILRIPKSLNVTRARARRLLAHEIEVHALRTANGHDSPLLLLGRGLAGYTNLEEGLALYIARLSDKIPQKTKPGLWQAWTVALLNERGLLEAKTILMEARRKLYEALHISEATTQAQEVVQQLIQRATRGLSNPGPAGLVFVRDHVYRTGYERVKFFVQTNGLEALASLFVGKIDLPHLPIIHNLKLSPSRLPDSLKNKLASH